ncbi:MAG: phosphate ABC transporter substrate-binding protein [Chloroflexi bacterium]|nr:MAG: phosphate ABC transporter substrate-binding protein [Chloroflexota bacterium]
MIIKGHRRSPQSATFAIGAVLVMCLFAGCGVPVPSIPTPDPLSGQYTATGGGGALPAVQALAVRFKQLHPGVNWMVTETGSDAAIKLAGSNEVDVGFISRPLADAEKARVAAVPIGFSGTAVVVNADNPVKNLTKDQLRRIYSGEVTSWVDLGGTDQPIRAFIREPNAATRTTFEAFVFGGKATYGKTVTEMFEVEPTLGAIASFRGGIGIASIGSRTANDNRVRMISIDGVAPTQANLANGTYKIFRPLFLVYSPDAAQIRPGIAAFLEFAKSPEGQRVAASAF